MHATWYIHIIFLAMIMFIIQPKNVYTLQQMVFVYWFRSWIEVSLQYVVWYFLNRCHYSHDCNIMWSITYDSEEVGCGTADVWGMKVHFKVVHQVWKCHRSSSVEAWVSNTTSNMLDNYTALWQVWYTRYHLWCALGGDLEDFIQLQVLLLWLWFWIGLQHRHGSLLHNVHVRRVSRTSVWHILKSFKWKVYIPRLLHAINDDNLDRWMQFCEWFQQMVNEDEEFVTKIVWSDEDQFKLNVTVNHHNCD